MSENEIDSSNPLDMDVSTLDTTRPLIKPGSLAEFKIVKASINTNDAKTFAVELEALSDLDGREPGITVPQARCKLFDNINTQPTGKLLQQAKPWDMILVNIAEFLQCFAPTLKPIELRKNPEQFQGLIGVVRVGIRNEGTGKDGVWRSAQNCVAEYIKQRK